jgi:hypothetical protein
MKFDIKTFANPAAEYRPMPLWTWNGRMTKGRITETLEQFAAQGLGGSFIHPRPGLMNEYLSDEWFELWGWALSESKRLGMQCNIYDENTYPSGYAGGHVADRHPEAAATYLVAEAGEDGQTLQVRQRKAVATPWTAWHPPVDMLAPRVAAAFIDTTHEAYAKHFPEELGKGIRYAFADEPTWMMRDDQCRRERGLPVSELLLEEFKNEHGYDLLPRITDLFTPGEAQSATRYDYYSTLHRVWMKNFLQPVGEWCRQHHVDFTGHFMEHEWPAPVNQGSTMDAFRWMQTPGIDLLGFQYDFHSSNGNSIYMLTVKEAASAARQLGCRRVLSETHGGGGHDVSFTRFKKLADWELVHGINFVNPHMSVESIAGARKYDWPQTYSDHSPWFAYYHAHAEHTARVCATLAQGRSANRTLLLQPTTTGWLHHIPAQQRHIITEPLKNLRTMQSRLVRFLADRQADFDLGDELLMRDFASVENGRLRVGEAVYDQVILPSGMETWCGSTLALMENYLAAGGILLAFGEAPVRIDGRPDSRPAQLKEKFPGNWKPAASEEELHALIAENCPPRITAEAGGPLPETVHYQYRELDGGQAVHFLVNTGDEAVSLDVCLQGNSLTNLETFTGKETSWPVRASGGCIVTTLYLPAAGHALWISSPETAANAAPEKPREKAVFQCLEKFDRIQRTAPNLLMLDYCTLSFRGERHEDIHVMDADLLIWKSLGFPQNVWDRAIQFRSDYSKYHFDETSGFAVEYRFNAAAPAEILREIELAVERPHLYRITVNGTPVDFKKGVRWFDEEIRRLPVGRFLKPGENRIRLERDVFDILCETDRIYLLGDFGLEPAERGFNMVASHPLTTGNWVEQGLPFYSGAVVYESDLEIPDSGSELIVRAAQWEGALIRVLLDGKEAGFIPFPSYELILAGAAPGKHRIGIEVVSSLRNLLGAHFSDALPSHWAWEDHPKSAPPGRSYRFVSQGLTGPVECIIR